MENPRKYGFMFRDKDMYTMPNYTTVEVDSTIVDLADFAKKNGHPSILAPPTFLTTIGYEQEKPYQYLEDLGIPIGSILHARQEYTNYEPIYAGDELRMESKIGEIYEKKDGMLEFVSFISNYKNQKNVLVAESVSTLVLRNNEKK